MRNPFKPISISLSPNTQADDVKLAFSLLFKKTCIHQVYASLQLEKEFGKHLGVGHAYAFNSGRSSLMAILEALGLPKGSQVLLQAFTCNAAVNPIRWAGLEPVFVDCDQNYNLSVADLKKKITPRARVVMVQHTFGQPTDMDEIVEICQKNNLILIEDCAHSLGAEYKSKKVGTFGKAAFFSFGRDKMISCVYGGMATTNDDELAKKIAAYQKKIGYPSKSWTSQQLLHPVLMNWLILPTYSIFGRYLLVLFQWLRVLSKAIHWKEKRGLKPDYFPKRLPDKLAILALHQFKKIDKFNIHRQKMANFYFEILSACGGLIPGKPKGRLRGLDPRAEKPFLLPNETADRKSVYLRFAVRHDNAAKIIKKAWHKNLLLGDWYRTPVDPFDTLPDSVGYIKGSCPNAESFAGKMINLPTHINISKKETRQIIDFLKNNS